MSHEIRRAKEKDIPKVIDLLVQVCNVHADGRPDLFLRDKTKYTAAQLSLLFEDDSRPVFVAVDETDEVQGYCFCIIEDLTDSNNRPPIKGLYIDDLCVDEQARGERIGQELFDYARAYAKELHCHHLTLNVWSFNESALRFYEKQGMTVLKRGMEMLL